MSRCAARTRTGHGRRPARVTTGLGLIAAGLTSTPPRPPRPSSRRRAHQHRSAPGPGRCTAPRRSACGSRPSAYGRGTSPVGADADGHLEVPPLDRPTLAGWYRHGVSPGETGNAVLVGHVDSAAGPAVFFDLGRLRPGDTVRVTRADAQAVATFAVDGVGSYPKDQLPHRRWSTGPATRPALRLITCGGRFDAVTGNYSTTSSCSPPRRLTADPPHHCAPARLRWAARMRRRRRRWTGGAAGADGHAGHRLPAVVGRLLADTAGQTARRRHPRGPTPTPWSTAPSTSTAGASPAACTTPTRTPGTGAAATPSSGWDCTSPSPAVLGRRRPHLRARRADRRAGPRRRAPPHGAPPRRRSPCWCCAPPVTSSTPS